MAGDDARTREIALTSAGRTALREATPYWRRAQQAVAAHIGAERLTTLIDTLGELEALHPALYGASNPGTEP